VKITKSASIIADQEKLLIDLLNDYSSGSFGTQNFNVKWFVNMNALPNKVAKGIKKNKTRTKKSIDKSKQNCNNPECGHVGSFQPCNSVPSKSSLADPDNPPYTFVLATDLDPKGEDLTMVFEQNYPTDGSDEASSQNNIVNLVKNAKEGKLSSDINYSEKVGDESNLKPRTISDEYDKTSLIVTREDNLDLNLWDGSNTFNRGDNQGANNSETYKNNNKVVQDINKSAKNASDDPKNMSTYLKRVNDALNKDKGHIPLEYKEGKTTLNKIENFSKINQLNNQLKSTLQKQGNPIISSQDRQFLALGIDLSTIKTDASKNAVTVHFGLGDNINFGRGSWGTFIDLSLKYNTDTDKWDISCVNH